VLASRRLTIPLLALAESTIALGRGELDTHIDDYNLNDEIGTLARHFQRMQQALKDYIEQLKQQTAQRERLEGELGAAHDIQMQMLPDKGNSNTRHPHWQLSAVLLPAKSVGGDLYHYQLLNEQELFFALGDVSDKGVAAALFMAKTQTLIRQLCATTKDLGKLLELINQQLSQDNSSCMFVTLLVGVLNTETGELRIASAGHTSPLLLDDACRFIDVATGPALGFFEEAEFSSTLTTLASSCPLILSTDGVDEASNSAQQHYGEERLQQLINSTHTTDAKELLDKVLNDVVEFRGDAEPSDDLTIMIITRL
jgi:sigma-B regulation protein RsbU (phosphoserine phosphatase)